MRSRDAALVARARAAIDVTTSALRKLPAFDGEVFRGVTTVPTAALQAYKPGAVLTEPAFTSGSRDPAIAFDGDAYFVIGSRTGRIVDACAARADEGGDGGRVPARHTLPRRRP